MSNREKILLTDNANTTIIVRLITGAVFLSEGIQKFLFPETVGSGRFLKIGFDNPEFWAAFTGCFEILCGILVLIGLFTRPAALIIFIIMIVAFITTKYPILVDKGFWTMAHEYRTDFAMTLSSIFLMIRGGGKWSVDKIITRKPDISQNNSVEKKEL